MCNHEKVISIWMKHNDLASMSIDHLNFEHDGYMPELGILGGDDTSLDICMRCGKILNWKEITNKDLRKAKIDQNLEIDDEKIKSKKIKEPKVFTLADIRRSARKDFYIRVLINEIGANWKSDPEALNLIEDLIANPPTQEDGDAAKDILKMFV